MTARATKRDAERLEKRPAPVVRIRRVPATGRLSEADMLQEYLQILPEQLAYVLGKPDALSESREMAKDALRDLGRAQRFIATLSPAHGDEVWNCMRLVLGVEGMVANELHARTAQVGGDTIRGGRKGALASHGPEADRAVQRKAYRDRYAYHAEKLPELNRTVLLKMVAEEFNVAPSTVATWVPNPTRTNRGRPRKN